MKLMSGPMRLARALAQSAGRLYSVRDNVHLGKRVHVGAGTTLWAPDSLTIADDVYIGKRCTIEVNGSIGEGSIIANNAGLIGRADHDFRRVGVSMRNAPWVGDASVVSDTAEHRLTIGADCWIGFGAVVLSGVSIGRGAIVSAGSVVTSDVQPYSIVGGCPARVIGTRFDPEEIKLHEYQIESSRQISPRAE